MGIVGVAGAECNGEFDRSCRLAQFTECDRVHATLVSAAAPSRALGDIEHAIRSCFASLLSNASIRNPQCPNCRRKLDGDLVRDELVVR